MTSPLKILINAWGARSAPDTASSPTWSRWLPLLAGHILFLIVVYSLLYAVGLVHNAPSSASLIAGDAGWYESIRRNGYVPNPTGQSNLAFFPLFPYFWRVLGLGSVGISVLNACLFLVSSTWLAQTFNLRRYQVLLLLSIPSVLFCFAPYTEAMFFFFGTILLRGLHRRQLGYTVLGLLGCCLTRSAASLFVPAFILAEVLACSSRAEVPRLLLRLGAGLATIAAALALVMYMHYLATGNPFVFFDTQQYWSHRLYWPLPRILHSGGGTPMLGLDLLALFIGLFALCVSLALGIRWLSGWRRPVAVAMPSRAFTFSLAYCTGILFVILLFYYNGDIANISRYLLATPFAWILIAQLSQWEHLSRSRRWLLAGGAGAIATFVAIWAGWPMRFPGFFPAEATFFFACWIAYGATYLVAFNTTTYSREVRAGLYVINVVYQVFLFDLFLARFYLG